MMLVNSWKKTAVTLRPTMLIIAGLVIMLLSGVLLVNGWAARNRAVGPPPDFQPLAEIDLSTQAWEDETVVQFSLAESAEVSLYFSVRNLDSPYFDLSLHGPEGYQAGIMHSETYRTDGSEAGWQRTFTLDPGDYRVVLTAEQSPGVLSIYGDTAR